MSGGRAWWPWGSHCTGEAVLANEAATELAVGTGGQRRRQRLFPGSAELGELDEDMPPTVCCFDGMSGSSSSRAGGVQVRETACQRPRYCERVLVHVYDLGDSFLTRRVWNSVAKSYGAFHSGVEVYGQEWLFGMTVGDEEDGSGISWHPPRENQDHGFRETLCMGFTSLSPEEVLDIIEEMKEDWKGSSYNMLTRNCHDFSNEFCLRLGVPGLPAWVNSLAPTGACTYEFFDNTDSGYDGGEGLFELLDALRSGLYSGLGWDAKHAAAPGVHW